MKQNLAVLFFLVFSALPIAAQTTELLPNQPIEREISEKNPHTYRLKAKSGDFVRVVVLQQNADIILRVFSTNEQKLYEANTFIERGESERFSFIAKADGEYQVEISFAANLRGQSAGKSYLIRLEALRLSTEKDRRQIAAENLYDQASTLSNENKADSRRAALKLFGESLLHYQAAADRAGEAYSFYSIGIIHSYLSEFPAAKENYAQAAKIFRSLDMKAQLIGVLVQDSAISLFTGDNQKAEELSLAALEIYRQLNDRRGEAEIIGNLGVLANRKNEPRRALEYFEKALPILRTEKDRDNEARILRSIGFTYNTLGEPFKAIESLEKALAISRADNELLGVSTALISLGVLTRNIGEVQRATDQLSEALAIVRQLGNRRNEAVCLNNLGSNYEYLGDLQAARENYEKSLILIRQLKMHDYEVNALYGLSNIELKEGNLPKALELSTQGWQIAREIGNKRLVAKLLFRVGETQFQLAEKEKALESFNQALTIQREIEDREGESATLVMIGKTNRRNGDLTTARKFLAQALQISQEMQTPPWQAAIYAEIADLEKESKNLPAAQVAIEKAIEITESTRAKLLRSDFRANFFSGQQSFYEFYIDLLVTQGKKAEALRASEQAKARNLLESLGESRFDIRAGISPENLAAERKFRQSVNAKNTLLLNALNAKQTEKAKIIEKELNELLSQYADLQAKIRAESPNFAALSQPQILSLNKFQAEVLDENSVLLEYSLGEERSFLFVTDKSSLEIIELPKRAEIEKAARQFIEKIRSQPSETLRGGSPAKQNGQKEKENLSRMLFGSALKKVENNRLLIVASGILQYIPFAALTNPEVPNKFLIETNEIVYLPSASVLNVLRNAPRKTQSKTDSLAIIADPVFAADDVRVKNFAKAKQENPAEADVAKNNLPRGLRSGFERLRFSRREAEEIGKFLPENKKMVALDFAANIKTANSDYLQKTKYIHFATHGVINSDLPELSGIVFSLVDENGKPQDGFLRLHDIYNMRLNADLVVLSACDSALGKEIKGEGIIGLTRGFMYAGAPSVVASLWKVEDRATAELMKRFYQALLKDKQKPSMALRTAQIEMLKDEQWQNPFYWAAFTLQGDWQ